jgi:hypothetical protein
MNQIITSIISTLFLLGIFIIILSIIKFFNKDKYNITNTPNSPIINYIGSMSEQQEEHQEEYQDVSQE